MDITIQLDVCAQPLLYIIPYIWLCNQPHPSSCLDKNVGLLLLQLYSNIFGVYHKKHCAFPLTPVFLISEN